MKSTAAIDKYRVHYHILFWILFLLSSMYRFENSFEMFEGRIFVLAAHKVLFSLAFFYLYDLRLSPSAETNLLILFLLFTGLILLYIYTNFLVYGWVVNHFQLPEKFKVIYQANWAKMSQEGPWTMLKDPVFLFVKILAILVFPLILKVIKRAYFASLSNVRMEQEKLQLEIDFFKSGINPQFLLNTLRSIRKFSEKDDDRASEMILKLSHLMRYTLYESHSDKVELQKEIDFLEEFVTLQETRLKDQVNISFFLTAKNIGRTMISPMILFPFFERAFQCAGSFVDAELNAEGSQLSLKLKADKKPGSGAGREGILNAKKRISREYEHHHTIFLTDSDTAFELELTLTLSNQYLS